MPKGKFVLAKQTDTKIIFGYNFVALLRAEAISDEVLIYSSSFYVITEFKLSIIF